MDAEKQIAEGFNAGYLIEKFQPELAKELMEKSKGFESAFIEGFVAGSKEYAKERGKSKFLGKIKSSVSKPPPLKSKDKGIDKER